MTIEYIISLLALWIVLVTLQSFIHYYIIEEEMSMPVYIQWNILRGMASIFHGIAFDTQDWKQFVPLLMFQLATHFAIFAPLLNTLRTKKFWYIGVNSGWLDGLLGKLNVNAYKLLYFLIIGSIPVSIYWILRVFWR